MSDVKELASKVDAAIAALEQAATAYVDKAGRLNTDYLMSRKQPHPVYERRIDLIRAAVGSRLKLAEYLGMSPTNPARSLEAQH